MAEDNQKWVDEGAAQVDVLNTIESSFSRFAASLNERHQELQSSVPKIDEAVAEMQKTVLNAARKSERAATDITTAAAKLAKDSGGEFAAWLKEAAKAREQIEAVVAEVTTNVKAVEDTLNGVRAAITELHAVENKVFPGIRNAIGEVKDAVERNTKAKIGDVAGALQSAPGIASEDVEKLRGEIADLKASLEAAKNELLAAKTAMIPGKADEAEKFNAGVVAAELSELKAMMFEMIRYMKAGGDRKIEIPPIEVKRPDPPPAGSPEELAERMASGYRDLVKLMAEKKNS